jgi:hypothetical protein
MQEEEESAYLVEGIVIVFVLGGGHGRVGALGSRCGVAWEHGVARERTRGELAEVHVRAQGGQPVAY